MYTYEPTNTIELIGYYGGDITHAQSAWTSTSRDLTEDKINRLPKLLEMLAKEGHHTPFEKSSLHFLVTVDQATHIHLLKHRIGVSCLTGDSVVQFLNTNLEAVPKLKFTFDELYQKWNNGRSHQNTIKDLEYSKVRLKKMKIETLDDQSLKIISSNIENIFYNGEKQTFEYILENGKVLKCTADHLVFTKIGWIPIQYCFDKNLSIAYKCHTNNPKDVKPFHPDVDYSDEIWKEFKTGYEVSNKGRVRSYYNNRHLTQVAKIKKITVSKGYNVVSISSKTHKVSRLVLETFKPLATHQPLQCRHLNNNSLDDRLENLNWGTDLQNKQDWENHPQNMVKFAKIVSVKDNGVQKVYDLTVAGTHNYIANGIVVHNCNGESARYKELKEDKFYLPEDFKVNIDSFMDEWNSVEYPEGQSWLEVLEGFTKHANHLYHECLKQLTPILGRKRAKESARYFKTFNSQITMDIMFNWRSFAHFQGLRNSEHSQKEVREVAQKMLNLVKNIEGNPFEYTIKAFGY